MWTGIVATTRLALVSMTETEPVSYTHLWDAHLFRDLDAEALQRGHMGGRVGEQTNAMDAEVAEYLTAEADLAQRLLRPLRAMALLIARMLRPWIAMKKQRVC